VASDGLCDALGVLCKSAGYSVSSTAMLFCGEADGGEVLMPLSSGGGSRTAECATVEPCAIVIVMF
jgi:hypothetical protein